MPETPPTDIGFPVDPWSEQKPATAATSDPWSAFNGQLTNWFQSYLKRTPGSGEYPLHQGTPGVSADNPASWAAVEQAIRQSQEYQGLQTPMTPTTPTTPVSTDPATAAVLAAFAKKGIQPRPGDVEYWTGKIATTGGWGNPSNQAYWLDRMAMPYGGVGDYSESGKVGSATDYRMEGGGPGSLPGVPGVSLTPTGSQYNDPYTTQLEDFIKFRLNELYQPVNDPFRQQYAGLLQDRTDALNANEGAVKQLTDYLQSRFTDLQTPGRTGAEQEVINTQAIEPLQLERAAAKQKMVEQLAARGITQDSGIFQEALLEIDRVFDAALATTRAGLTADELNRREARFNEAGQVGASLVDIPDARAREALGTAQQLSGLSSSVRGEEEARRNQALSLVGFLANLGPERMNQAMAALGMTGATPSSSLDSLLKIAGLNTQNTALNNQSSAGFWSGLGSIAALMANQPKTTTPAGGAPLKSYNPLPAGNATGLDAGWFPR